MRKSIAIGATVMMLAAAGTPLTADAAAKIKVLNVNCIKPGVIVLNGNCEWPEDSTKPENPETPNAPESSEKTFAQQVVDLVNGERAKEGLDPLTIEVKLEQAALVRAKEIQTNFSHTRPNGTSFGTAIKEAGMSYRTSGENIAWGQKTPEAVVKAWMNSPSHRANIMKKSHKKIGVAYVQNGSGTPYWVQLFTN